MDREGLKALAEANHREVVISGATFRIKRVDMQEAIEALGERAQSLLMGYFFDDMMGDAETKQAAAKRLQENPELQRAMMDFRRAVLIMGMVDPVLTEAGEREDLDPASGPAKVSLTTLGDIARELHGEILGGEQGKAGGE